VTVNNCQFNKKLSCRR